MCQKLFNVAVVADSVRKPTRIDLTDDSIKLIITTNAGSRRSVYVSADCVFASHVFATVCVFMPVYGCFALRQLLSYNCDNDFVAPCLSNQSLL